MADDTLTLDLKRGAVYGQRVIQELVPGVRQGGKVMPDPKAVRHLNETVSMTANLVASRHPDAPLAGAVFILAGALAPMICPHIEGGIGERPLDAHPELTELIELFAASLEQQLVMQHAKYQKEHPQTPKLIVKA